ncbi:hypothetical protein GCM10009716_40010 [Streptomyces sodiiphilus]|uniref:Uncharacterized protein n=1 Tax=Streptomyces sodiiphilus TaxID=226217 RepID=A0ABN2PPL7_9ACTN
MRDLIACFAIWLVPGLRRSLRRAHRRVSELFVHTPVTPSAQAVLPRPPAFSRRPFPAHVRARLATLDGHKIALVRPYVLAQERRRAEERRLQRERRTAAVLATVGIDYLPAPPSARHHTMTPPTTYAA